MKARLFLWAWLGCAARRLFWDVATDHPGPCAGERADARRLAGILRRGTWPRPRQGRHRPRQAGGRLGGNPLPGQVVRCVLAPKRGPGGWGVVGSEEPAAGGRRWLRAGAGWREGEW